MLLCCVLRRQQQRNHLSPLPCTCCAPALTPRSAPPTSPPSLSYGGFTGGDSITDPGGVRVNEETGAPKVIDFPKLNPLSQAYYWNQIKQSVPLQCGARRLKWWSLGTQEIDCCRRGRRHWKNLTSLLHCA